MENNFNNNHFLFWQKWLFYSSVLFAFYGIVFALYGNNLLFIPYNKMLAMIFWNSPQFPSGAERFRAFIYGPLGGTITCCYILLAFIARYPFKEKQRWSRNAIVVAFSVWVIIDSSICVYFGVYPQIYLINAFSITIKALPIIFTWKYFSNPMKSEVIIE
ncbi:hypothetical protein [Parasediminibacterium sp. JCM 36343]|uniref:hypothetical protein n=1 Tax=Parasediminibacterium sp. JCM 36343 TaxID=3374279 RepID=UPI00397D5D20